MLPFSRLLDDRWYFMEVRLSLSKIRGTSAAPLLQAIARHITPLYLSRLSWPMSVHRKLSHAESAGPRKHRRH